MIEDVFTPIMWDSRKNGFFPIECFPDARYPMLSKEDCEKVCREMNEVILSNWQPRTGETYWHPCTWVPRKGFIPMDCSVTFEKASYPAFRNERECEDVCDKLNEIFAKYRIG